MSDCRAAGVDEDEDIMAVLAASAEAEQAEAILLALRQVERNDHVLLDALSQYARAPRGSPRKDVSLDFQLIQQLYSISNKSEQKSWKVLLIGAAMRGDQEGSQAVEDMIRHRLSGSVP
jgi:hypothetical protein